MITSFYCYRNHRYHNATCSTTDGISTILLTLKPNEIPNSNTSAEALALLRAHLPPNAILVGQSILKDVQWLQLAEGVDYFSLIGMEKTNRIFFVVLFIITIIITTTSVSSCLSVTISILLSSLALSSPFQNHHHFRIIITIIIIIINNTDLSALFRVWNQQRGQYTNFSQDHCARVWIGVGERAHHNAIEGENKLP
jgi:hypothetical protein